MNFTTQIFIFLFFPLCLAAYWLIQALEKIPRLSELLQKIRAKDLLLVAFSLVFYLWALVPDAVRLILYVLTVYLLGSVLQAVKKRGWALSLRREENAETQEKRLPLAAIFLFFGVLLLVGILARFKYSNVLAQAWNWLFKGSAPYQSIAAPIGISFLTFSAISYLTDIYRGHADSGSLLDCALYLTFFPKIISGPIVLWKDFQGQIQSRRPTQDAFLEGINRIIIGFGKKVILADSFGACLSAMGGSVDQITALGSLLLYMMQIYYDFSGYSDIAIGLSKLFGFQFKENFNFPYRSASISEFWRRWHISLGTWFREYVYFPLGGSRAGKRRTLINLAVVFAITGIWHGAGANYFLWGGINGLIVILERVIQDKPFYRKIPKALRCAGTMLLVLVLWQLFRFPTVKDVRRIFSVALGITKFDTVGYTWEHFFDLRTLVLLGVGILGATVFGSPGLQKRVKQWVGTKPGLLVQEILLLALFVLSILFMVNSTYQPFIYFQY